MSKKKKIYTVATAHLDTIWSWDFEKTVSTYIYNTLVDNFKMFEKYPTYKFNFEGSYRYGLWRSIIRSFLKRLRHMLSRADGMSAALLLKTEIPIFHLRKHFSETFFSAIPILIKPLEKKC